MTQTDILLNHFKYRASITNVEAGAVYRIRSLHRRILDLEALGYAFRREWKKDPTGQRYLRYYFEGRKLEKV